MFVFFSRRFRAGLIYTYIGEVCVSVNPYRTLNIYGQDYINKYKGNVLHLLTRLLLYFGYLFSQIVTQDV